MDLTTIGALAAKVSAPAQDYAAGIYTTEETVVGPGYSAAVILIDLSAVTSMTADIKQSLLGSSDDGQTWEQWGGAELNLPRSGYVLTNGVLTTSSGGPIRNTGYMGPLPNTHLTRRVKVTLEIDEPLTLGTTLGVW